MPEHVSLTTRLNKGYVPVTRTPQLVYALLTAKPGETIARSRMALNFGFVLDRSGSMRGEKIARLIDAVRLALGKVSTDDLVSVTTFNDRADVVAAGARMSEHRSLADQIARIRAGGGTQMSRGLSLGLREVYRRFDKNRVNQVILLTDGQTYGDEEQCLRLANEAGDHHIAIQAFGLGSDWNESLLDEMARRSSGNSDLIESPDEIVPLFSQTVERSQRAIVRNARVTLRLVSGVVPRQVWQVTPVIANLGYAPIGEHDVQVELGELDAEQGKSLLVELVLPPRQAGRFRIAQAQLGYDLPLEHTSDVSGRSDIVVDYVTDPALVRTYDPTLMNIVEKVTAFKLQTRALEEAQQGNIIGATQKLRAAATRLLELGEDDLARAANQEADNLEQAGQMSSGGTKKLRYQTRKLTQEL